MVKKGAKPEAAKSPEMLQELARKVEVERVSKCMEEVKAVMEKHRCQFSPRPKWVLRQDDTWGTIIELGFKAAP